MSRKVTPLLPFISTYGRRLVFTAPAVLLTSFLLLFFGPVELIHYNSTSLSFQLGDLLLPLLCVFICVFCVASLLLALLRGRIFLHAVSLVFWLGVSAYLQSAFLNPPVGLLTGDVVDWQRFTTNFVASLHVWLGLGFLLELLLTRHALLWRSVVLFLSLCLVVMMLVPTGMVLVSHEDDVPTVEDYTLNAAGLHELSSSKNIMVIVLDRLDFDYIESMLAQQPDLFSQMDGFIGYNNALSPYARTKPALAALMTGADNIAYFSAPDEFLTNVWTDDGKDVLGDLTAQGYTIELYTQPNYIFRDPAYPAQHVDNFIFNNNNLLLKNTLGKAYHLSLYRYVPSILKPAFFADTTFYNTGIYDMTSVQPYSFDDSRYLAQLSSPVIGAAENSFRLYHFYGTHNPYHLTADGLYSAEETTVEEQGIGCFTLLQRTFDQMKELGIYDNAAIIITGDHGAPMNDAVPVAKETRTGIFYKPSGSSGAPFSWSSAPVSTDNISATVMQEAGVVSDAYGTPLLDVPDNGSSVRPYYKSVHDPQTYREIGLYIYDVVGDASDFENWHIIEYTDIEHSYY